MARKDREERCDKVSKDPKMNDIASKVVENAEEATEAETLKPRVLRQIFPFLYQGLCFGPTFLFMTISAYLNLARDLQKQQG